MSEAAFLEAIKAAPHDTAVRLVYADWLEERGDPRAELIRIEEEMRPLSVFSDRFWQLKPRRYELLQKFLKDWLETMRYGTDCPPTITHVPSGWKQWWRLLRVFAERWHKIRRPEPYGDVGRPMEVIDQTESRLGRKLPPSLREWLAFAHEVWPVTHRTMCRIDDFAEVPALSLMKFPANSRGYFGIRHQDLAMDDPPVVALDGQGGFSAGYPHLAACELEWILRDIRGGGGGFAVQLRKHDARLRDIRRDFPVHFQFGDPLRSAHPFACVDFFEKDNLLLMLWPINSGHYLRVEVSKRLPMDEVPRYLWDLLAEDSHGRHGMFNRKSVKRMGR